MIAKRWKRCCLILAAQEHFGLEKFRSFGVTGFIVPETETVFCAIPYHQIHIKIAYKLCMQTLRDLAVLLEQYIAFIPALNLDGDELEEFSTVLLQFQNQVETGEPNEAVVKKCLAYLERFKSKAA